MSATPNTALQRTRSAPLRLPLSFKMLGGMKAHRVVITLSVAIMLAPSLAFGKCGWAVYQLNATVTDRASQAPLAGASLVFFADGEAETWLADWTETKPERYLTDVAGRFTGAFRLSTYSGWFPVDRCNRKLKRVTVVVTRAGYVGKRFTVDVPKLLMQTEAEQIKIELPAFALDRAH